MPVSVLLAVLEGDHVPEGAPEKDTEGLTLLDVETSGECVEVGEREGDAESRGLPVGEAVILTLGVTAVELKVRADNEGEGVSDLVASRHATVPLTEGDAESRVPVGAGEPEPVTLEEGELEAHTEAVRDTDAERDCRPAGEGVLRTAVPEALGEGERECVGVPDCDGEVLREAVREAPDALPPKRDAVGDMLAERDTDTEPVEEADWESQ